MLLNYLSTAVAHDSSCYQQPPCPEEPSWAELSHQRLRWEKITGPFAVVAAIGGIGAHSTQREMTSNMVTITAEIVKKALLAAIEGGDDPRMQSIVARADCFLTGSYTFGKADSASDLDILAFTEDEWQVEGVIAPFGSADRRPGPGVGLPTMADVLQWRAKAGLGIAEIEVVGPQGRAAREADLAHWAFILGHARLLCAGWGGGNAYRQATLEAFQAARPALAAGSLIRFQRYRNQAQTTLLHGEPIAIALAVALAVREAMRAWLLWSGKSLPTDKWLPEFVAPEPGAGTLMELTEHLLNPIRSTKDRFEDAWRLRDLLAKHVRSAAGDPSVLWIWPPKPDDMVAGPPVEGNDLRHEP